MADKIDRYVIEGVENRKSLVEVVTDCRAAVKGYNYVVVKDKNGEKKITKKRVNITEEAVLIKIGKYFANSPEIVGRYEREYELAISARLKETPINLKQGYHKNENSGNDHQERILRTYGKRTNFKSGKRLSE